MVLMIHLSVELVNDEVSIWNKSLKTSLLAIALLQVLCYNRLHNPCLHKYYVDSTMLLQHCI